MARNPQVLLLDEPLSALDKKLREETQHQLTGIQRKTGTTFIVVTHDQEEAMSMAHRIGVLDHGQLIQVDTPRTLYERPKNRLTADFIGRANLFTATVSGKGKSTTIHSEDFGGFIEPAEQAELADGQKIWIAVRPERINVKRTTSTKQPQMANHATGVLTDTSYLGGTKHLRIALDNGYLARIIIAETSDASQTNLQVGDTVEISFDKHAAHLLEN